MDSPISSKNSKRKVLMTLLLLSVVGTVLMLLSNKSPGNSYNVAKDRLTIVTVSEGQFDDAISIRGSITPAKSVYLDAIEGGRVDKLYVEEGAEVKAGQKLMELSNTSLQLDVISREAQISEQLNNLHNTRLAIDQNRLRLKRDLLEMDYQLQQLARKLKQNEVLVAKKLLSEDKALEAQQEYEYLTKRRELIIEQQRQDEKLRTAQIKQLEGNVEQLNRNLLVTRKNLENLTVRAPVDGLLSSLDAQMGESKARGVRLGQVDIVDEYKVTARVDEFYVNRVTQGQRATFVISGKPYQLVLSKIYAQINGGQFEVDFMFEDNKPQNIRRGQSLQINLHLGESVPATLLTNGGFYSDTAGKWAFVLDSDGKLAMRRDIRTGRRNNRHIEVLSGLNVGDRVVVSSYGNFAQMTQLNFN